MTRSDIICPHGNQYMARCQLCDPPTADIVDRLYRYGLQYNPVLEAVDTISRLRAKIEELHDEINDLRQQIVTLSIPKQARK